MDGLLFNVVDDPILSNFQLLKPEDGGIITSIFRLLKPWCVDGIIGECMDEEEIIHIILTNLPIEFEQTKLNFIRQRNSQVDKLTLESMIQQLRDMWKYSRKVEELKMKDLALSATMIHK